MASLTGWLIAAVPTSKPVAVTAVATPVSPPDTLGGPALADHGVAVSPQALAPPPEIAAAAWLVADADSGAVLAARDAHGQYLPASTLKILTALAVLPHLSPAQEVTISDAAARVDGTRVGLVPGMTYTVAELATAMIVASGNDAAVALAEAAGGTAATITMMNRIAADLNARNTHAGDPSGLDAPGQTTSAYDLALLGRAALTSPAVRGFLTIPRATVRGRDGASFQIQNHNDLLGSYPGTIGVKNGYTVAAGATYVGAVRRGNHTLIVTMLRAVPAYAKDARALFDWGFAYVDSITPVGWLAMQADAASHAVPVADAAAAAAAGDPPRTGTGHSRDSSSHDEDGADETSGAGGHAVGLITWTAVAVTLIAAILTLRRRLARRRPFPSIGALPGMAAQPAVTQDSLASIASITESDTGLVRIVTQRRGDGDGDPGRTAGESTGSLKDPADDRVDDPADDDPVGDDPVGDDPVGESAGDSAGLAGDPAPAPPSLPAASLPTSSGRPSGAAIPDGTASPVSDGTASAVPDGRMSDA
ncbi:D-alanyl-D-alanine carboxypeptidase family protein [Protofrankia symbiont of Coriaria ruscifolia]|uniref:D-alanyl-D-alanine carboxypeptidase family protein n=1 Tax=Protofrankia symbiont of Coriaria ruscifolia TaxID=1306542 RepID=UPI001F5F4332|nr:serine hydrolase [Protofrankia symbiont of Coriaria ruscifolia]